MPCKLRLYMVTAVAARFVTQQLSLPVRSTCHGYSVNKVRVSETVNAGRKRTARRTSTITPTFPAKPFFKSRPHWMSCMNGLASLNSPLALEPKETFAMSGRRCLSYNRCEIPAESVLLTLNMGQDGFRNSPPIGSEIIIPYQN